MATPRNTNKVEPWFFSPTRRRFARNQVGWNGDKTSVYPYRGYISSASGTQMNPYNGAYLAIDAVNTASLHDFLIMSGIPPWAQPAYNKAYARFREEAVGEKSQIGAAFAEWKDSLGMVHKRAIGLFNSARSLRKGDFRGFLRSLSVSPKRKHRNKTRAALDETSGLWLEYWFGWAPAAGDIFNALSTMSRDYSPKPQFGASGCQNQFEVHSAGNDHSRNATIIHKIGGQVRVVNPNLFLLNQLGLANPAAIAWEVVPFSFMVDWVVDVGSYLESFTDWVGLEIDGAYSTSVLKFTDTVHSTLWYMTPGVQKCTGSAMIRRTSIPRPLPNLQFTANLGRATTRTATAVSLLTQTLLSMKR